MQFRANINLPMTFYRHHFVAAVGVVVSLAAAVCQAQPVDTEGVQGTWKPVSGVLSGEPFPRQSLEQMTLQINKEGYTYETSGFKDVGTIQIDGQTDPKQIDLQAKEGPNRGQTVNAIFKIEGDRLTICYELSGKNRPTSFSSPKDSQILLLIYEKDASSTGELPEEGGPSAAKSDAIGNVSQSLLPGYRIRSVLGRLACSRVIIKGRAIASRCSSIRAQRSQNCECSELPQTLEQPDCCEPRLMVKTISSTILQF